MGGMTGVGVGFVGIDVKAVLERFGGGWVRKLGIADVVYVLL